MARGKAEGLARSKARHARDGNVTVTKANPEVEVLPTAKESSTSYVFLTRLRRSGLGDLMPARGSSLFSGR